MLILLVLLYLSDVHEMISFDYLKMHRSYLESFYYRHPAQFLTLFALAFVFMTSLYIPGATIFTLIIGAIVPFLPALIVVSISGTIGSTLATLLSRYAFREWATTRFHKFFSLIDQGVKENGGFYLLNLRLVPIAPYFFINLVMGLTNISLRTFFIVSWIGMIPRQALYITAGQELGRISSPSEVMSWKLFFIFLSVGLLPLFFKLLLKMVAAAKYKKLKFS